jgi:NitT/TauT family transport system substrate-binding protein
MFKSRSLVLGAATACAVALILAPAGALAHPDASGAVQSAKLTPFNVCIGVQIDYAPVFVGLKLGIWKKHGLDVKVHACPTSPISIASLLSGDNDVANNSVTGATTAIGNGIPIKVIAPVSIQPTKGNTGVLVLANSPYKKFSDLAGKTLGTLTVQGLFDLAIRSAIKAQGADPESLKVIGAAPTDLGSLLAGGRVDAIMFQDPQFTLTKLQYGRQFRDLGNPFSVIPWGKGVVIGAFTTSDTEIQKKPAALKAFLAGWKESVAAAVARPSLARYVMGKYTTLDPKVIPLLTWPKFTSTGLTVSGVGPMLRAMHDIGFLKALPDWNQIVWTGK